MIMRIFNLNRNLFLLMFSLVSADLFTKLIAYHLIPTSGRWFSIGDYFYIQLVISNPGFGSQYRQLYGDSQTFSLLSSFALFLFAPSVFIISRTKLTMFLKIVLGLSLYFLLYAITILLSKSVVVPHLNSFVLSFISKTSAVAVIFTLLSVSSSFYYQLSFSILLAGGIGNTLSFLYPPFKIVDFIYCDLLFKLLHTTVFNLADLYVDIFYVLFPTVIIYSIIKSVRKSYSQKVAT